MANIMLRPDLRTTGGEVSDIVLGGKYAGTLTLVYRDGDRVSGSVQLEQESLSRSDKDQVIQYVHSYVQSLIGALQAEECDVLVTYSSYDHIIATDNNVGVIDEFLEEDGELEYDYVEEDARLNDIDPAGQHTLDMVSDDDSVYYELVQVSEHLNRTEYHIYDWEQELVAEAYMHIYDTDVVGDVSWRYHPSEEEIEIITDLIVSDYDENVITTFVIDMKHKDEVIETIELAHEELLDDDDEDDDEDEDEDDDDDDDEDEDDDDDEDEDEFDADENEDYSVILIRDDEDTITYEIYQQSHGGFPIGTATIDISQRQITGFIDFREPGSADGRELIATILMRELDKEKEYDSLNLTMLYQNEPIDELLFKTEPIH